MTLPARTTPRIDLVLVELLRDVLPAGVAVRNLRPGNWAQLMPLVEIRAVGPAATTQTGAVHGLAKYPVDVQCWAATRDVADDLDQLVWDELLRARRTGRSAAGGHLASLEGGPGAEVRDLTQDDRVFRWQASNTVGLRATRR